MKMAIRIAAVLLAMAGAVFLAPTAASAEGSSCGALAGSYASNNYIGLCIYDRWTLVNEDDGFWLQSSVAIGANATSATNCVVTVWAELDKAGSSPWSSKQYPINCKAALTHRGTSYTYTHVIGGTSGTQINTHGCISLYFNNSTTSGWQRCSTTGWHNLTP
ncbi:hypothetical protein [Dactylosporangium sp. CS-033363]|uniref:hypothetical protein n=1 Tax=Dactylosporangium sp. CS-033363 TaxID=3239935 RepID=UPI003D94BABF